jgi:hypothetical protein
MTLLIGIIVCVALLTVLGPLIRIVLVGFFLWVVITAMTTSGSNVSSATVSNPTTLTYDQLVNYPSDCSKKEEQLKELREIQRVKNFDPDPDKLDPWDRAYNSRLKASIWWYSYGCDK